MTATPTTPTPDDAARAAARDLGWFTDPELITDAFVAGATWQRARIAARRDEVEFVPGMHAHCNPVTEVLSWSCGMDMRAYDQDLDSHVTDAVLAALGVDRG